LRVGIVGFKAAARAAFSTPTAAESAEVGDSALRFPNGPLVRVEIAGANPGQRKVGQGGTYCSREP